MMRIELLNKSHNKKDFSCGSDLLDQYIKNQASQDMKKMLSTCTVLVENEKVIGYYTLSSNPVEKDSLPEDLSRKFPPSYTKLPCVLLGRLAVDERYKGQGLGEILLMHALKKAQTISREIGVLCVVVDPIDDKSVNFYKKYGFIYLPTSGKMMISIKTIQLL